MNRLRAFVEPLLILATALGAGSALLVLFGESPGVLFTALGNSIFTSFGLGYSLFYATPLILTGLAVAIPFQCGLFNIGGEGQLYLGAIAIVAVAALLPEAPAPIALPLGVAAAALAGAALGYLAGWLKAKRGSHEVIVTILLNFLAIAAVNWLLLHPLDAPESQAPETLTIGGGYHLARLETVAKAVGLDWFASTPVNLTLFGAVLVAVAAHFLLFRSVAGFELRAVGQSHPASRYAGISVAGVSMGAMALGGAAAGLVGVNEVMGYKHSVLEGFSPGYGFTGIAVALLARNRPLRILPVALLFGALTNGARELEFFSEKVTKELSLVLQAVIIAMVASHPLGAMALTRLRARRQTRTLVAHAGIDGRASDGVTEGGDHA
jgi:simple sugar transport system permease protein